MIRFAWLQSRTQILGTMAALIALAGVAAVTGIHLSQLYGTLVAHCHTGCDLATHQFVSHDEFLSRALDLVALAAPAMFGIFWGAPLLTREFETGTFRLAWTQSVTRSRWLTSKLVMTAIATALAAGLLTTTITWWARALDSVDTNQYAVFDRRGIAPVGYALFAFAAGALAGAIIRRTLPSMATTLVAVVVARVVTAVWIRPHLLSPLHKSISPHGADQFGVASINGSASTLVGGGSGGPNSWTLSSHFATSSGQVAGQGQLTAFVHQNCPGVDIPQQATSVVHSGVAEIGSPDAGSACLAKAAKVFHFVVTYQPAGRYWALQWLEAGIFVVLALVAAAGCYWWVLRRAV